MAAPSSTTEPLLPTPFHLQKHEIGQGSQDPAGWLISIIITTQVTGIMQGDKDPPFLQLELNLSLLDQFV